MPQSHEMALMIFSCTDSVAEPGIFMYMYALLAGLAFLYWLSLLRIPLCFSHHLFELI